MQEQAVELFFKIKREDVALYQYTFEGYDNVGLVSSYRTGEIIRVLTTADFAGEVMEIMHALAEETDFEKLSDAEAEHIKYWFRTREGAEI